MSTTVPQEAGQSFSRLFRLSFDVLQVLLLHCKRSVRCHSLGAYCGVPQPTSQPFMSSTRDIYHTDRKSVQDYSSETLMSNTISRILRSFSSLMLRSSAAFLSDRIRLASLSCRNLLNLIKDSCSSKSLRLRISSRSLNTSS